MKKPVKIISTIIVIISVFTFLIFTTPNQASASSGTCYEMEPNNTVDTADPTYDDYDAYGAISSSTDVDWWFITFNSDGMANFYLGSIPSGCNYDLRIYNSTGSTLIVESVKTSNTSELCKIHVKSGEEYAIKIYSSSGYSASNYKLRVKRYNLQQAKLFASPYDNYGNNYSGATSSNNILQTMGYSTVLYASNTASQAFDAFPNSSVIVTNSHGGPGKVIFTSAPDTFTYLYANTFSTIPSTSRALADLSSSALSDSLLIIYKGCSTGVTHSVYGNLVDKSLNKGAFCCLGWYHSINTLDGNRWVNYFLNKCKAGKNVGAAFRLTNDWVYSDEAQGLIDEPDIISDIRYSSSRMFAVRI